MLDTAEFSISSQVSFLTFVYARLLGMMGPLEATGPGSLMTFDGSPVELSWVIPSKANTRDCQRRQLRFAIEPIDPRSGRLLRANEVLRYLTSSKGSLGLVRCDRSALDWSMITQHFLYPDGDTEGSEGERFFIGFDFSPSGDIVLKTYYLPAPRPTYGAFLHHAKGLNLGLWDSDYRPLRDLLDCLDPSLVDSLNMMISYVDEVNDLSKPRLQILSMDCVPNEVNRLKLYCRPTSGNSWRDARRAFTLGGRLASSKMNRALARLETLWNLLFPFTASDSNRDLDDALLQRSGSCHRGTADHPTGGLLYYYSLVPGSDMVLPKIYLPVARYCSNDLFITQALEKFHAIDGRGSGERDWVSREVAAA
ncbi:hypothetical protein DXG03_005975 [Asterophora parasitica]|uniref:Aromatic prenyltransferase n=1 Tax=Asterophora parasitica TaxID=117018 RepID=A0A9P7G5Y0_9AGAR|nr:hypothetical protein DXG03_005975 [Asterophora parasitica]